MQVSLYVKSHLGLGRHPKTRRLASVLGVSVPTALGHVHLLWHFAAEWAPDGNLSSFTDDDIERGAMWESPPDALPGVFRQALLDTGWLDRNGHLHDWDLYGGKVLAARVKAAARQRRYRAHTNGNHNG